MCSRYTLKTPADVYEAVFRLMLHYELRRRYNIAPTQDAPIIRQLAGPDDRESAMLRWGLIPSWAKDAKMGNRLINARIETARERPAFRSAWRHRRCLVPADGFFEWKPIDGRKQPYHVHAPDDRLFAFAGLWESWTDGDGTPVESYTILTCPASKPLRTLHDRMPVILPARSEMDDRWLTGPIPEPESMIDAAHVICPRFMYQPL